MLDHLPLSLTPAEGDQKRWAKNMVVADHYLHTVPDPRTRPFCYIVALGCWPVGCLWFGRPEATCCYKGSLTYGSLDDVKKLKRARFDRWEVLCLSRVWFTMDVQVGGYRCVPGFVPGFTDRKGVFRSTLASTAILASLERIGFDYLMANPPCFVNEPYKIRAVMSYCDTRLHKGLIYRASGFELARVNKDGIETWWTPKVATLTAVENRRVRALAKVHPRSIRIREMAGVL